jgi:hypothetical protein
MFGGPAGWWEWPYFNGVKLVMENPETSAELPKKGPYQAGTFYGDKVIEKVSVKSTHARGWLWVLSLRGPKDDDYLAFWEILREAHRDPKEPRCHECGSYDNVRTIPAMTCYHFEPGEEDPNKPVTLCDGCGSDYESYWTERWQEYRAGL